MSEDFLSRENYLEAYGTTLLLKGYDILPIPLGAKHSVGVKDWGNLKVTEELLAGWVDAGYEGISLKAALFPALDIDVLDEDVANQLEEWARENLGQTPVRVGRAPRRLLMFGAISPTLKKRRSATYIDPQGIEHSVELLGAGQQYAIYAIHPDTHKPYEWKGGSPLTLELFDLPEITPEGVDAFFSFFESIVPATWSKIRAKTEARSSADGVAVEDALARAKPTISISREELEMALANINADDYDTWVKVGMALHHQYSGDEEGLALWDQWSQNSPKYDAQEVKFKWKGFNALGGSGAPVTVATIMRMGRPTIEAKEGLEEFLERFVYVCAGDLVDDLKAPPQQAMMKLKEFKTKTSNIRYWTEVSGKPTSNAVWGAWIVHPDRKTAEGLIYDPSNLNRIVTDDLGQNWINTAKVEAFEPTQETHLLSTFFDHMQYLFPVEIEREWFLDWMAFNLQRPHMRCKVTPLHVSIAHGTGRGWLVHLLSRLLGRWNVTKTKMKELMDDSGSGFNGFLANSLLCCIEEVREPKKRYEVSDRIRDTLTEDFLEVNVKWGGQGTRQIFTNFFFMSNHPDALAIPKEDRRINVFSGADKAQPTDYYLRLYAWLETQGVRQLHAYLKRRDLSNFNWLHAMETEARTKMIFGSQSDTELAFKDWLEDLKYKALTFKQIEEGVRNRRGNEIFDESAEKFRFQLIKLLQHTNATPVVVKHKGVTKRAWKLAKEGMSNEDIRNEIERFDIENQTF